MEQSKIRKSNKARKTQNTVKTKTVDLEWTETTAEKYDEMLNVLPPAAWIGGGFLVGEPWDHDSSGRPRFEAYIHTAGKHYVSSRPITVNELRAIYATKYASVAAELTGGAK